MISSNVYKRSLLLKEKSKFHRTCSNLTHIIDQLIKFPFELISASCDGITQNKFGSKRTGKFLEPHKKNNLCIEIYE